MVDPNGGVAFRIRLNLKLTCIDHILGHLCYEIAAKNDYLIKITATKADCPSHIAILLLQYLTLDCYSTILYIKVTLC